jgi:hypothetical protein
MGNGAVRVWSGSIFISVMGRDKACGYGGRVFVGALMGHCKGKNNVKKRISRRKKTERLALAKSTAAAAK